MSKVAPSESNSAQLPDSPITYETYFELLTRTRVWRTWIWVIVGVLATAIPLLGFLRWPVKTMIGTFPLLGACIAVLPLAMKGIYAILRSWTDLLPIFVRHDGHSSTDYKRRAQGEFKALNTSPIPRNFGLAYAGFAFVAFWLGGAFVHLPKLMMILCGAITLLSSFVCGVGLAAIFFLGRSIWRLGRDFPIRVSEHGFGVLSVGRALLRSYFLVAVVWCCYTASGTFALEDRWVPLLALAAPSFVFFVSSFILCQFPLHLRMVDCKKIALLELDDRLEELRRGGATEMSADRQRQIDFCAAEMKRVNHWPEWPFSFGNLFGVVGVSVGAIAPPLIQIALILIKQKQAGST